MSECEGCFSPIEECLGYGSCVPRLRRTLSDSQTREAMLRAALEQVKREMDADDEGGSCSHHDALAALSQSTTAWLKREKAKAEARGLFTLWQILEISRIAAAVNGDENTKRAIENIKTEAKRRAAALEAEADKA